MFDFQRFLDAQEHVYPRVVAELRAGQKRSHWMWFIFPQIAGLGRSATAQKFAIASLAEAQAYAAHPVLGPRLRECTELVLNIDNRPIDEIFAYPDHLKFHSCMTLFQTATQHYPETHSQDAVPDDNTVFAAALTKYFSGHPDANTLAILGV
ncbi:MAG TPA: DUF1810 domain-containing protein [Pirellulales bacterium]|nr:DUF1810 domain-containing protein [Pirellulales bacterium]